MVVVVVVVFCFCFYFAVVVVAAAVVVVSFFFLSFCVLNFVPERKKEKKGFKTSGITRKEKKSKEVLCGLFDDENFDKNCFRQGRRQEHRD